MLLKEFSKMNTFLTVARERSFSKASARIGISQPAVTQQIKAIEEYMQCRVVERRRNGITLTKEGQALLAVLGRVEGVLKEGEQELMRIANRQMPLVLSACPVVGNYLLPCCLSDLRRAMEGALSVVVSRSQESEEALKSRRADVALFAPSTFNEAIFYREWIEDEIVVVSNQPIAETIDPKSLEQFEWIARDDESETRQVTMGALKSAGMDCQQLLAGGSVFNDATAIKQALIKGPKDPARPMVSMLSRFTVSDELSSGVLHAGRIKGCAVSRKLYIACLKERKAEAPIDRAVRFLNEKRALAATF